MKQDDIIRMAREAGIDDPESDWMFWKAMERFAELIAAMIGIAQHRRGYESGLRDGAEAEREACAKVAEWTPDAIGTSQKIAAAIRARSTT